MGRIKQYQVWGLYLGVAFLVYYWFGGYISIANDFYNLIDSMVWRTVAYAGLHDQFLFDHKGPYFQWINMLGIWLSYDKWGLFWINVLNMTVVIAIIDKTVLLFTDKCYSRISAIAVFILVFLMTKSDGITVEAYSLVFQFLPLYLFIKYLYVTKHKKFPLMCTFVMGLCFGVIAYIRVNNACINVSIIVVLAFIYLRDKDYLGLAKHIGVFTLAFVVTSLPVIIVFGSKGVLDQVMHATFFYNFKYVGAGSTLSFDGLIVLRLLILISPLLLTIWPLYRIHKGFFSADLIMFLLFTILMCVVYLPSRGFSHYYMVITPIIVMAVIYFALIDIPTKLKHSSLLLIVLLFIIFFPKIASRVQNRWQVDWGLNIVPSALLNNYDCVKSSLALYQKEIENKKECFKISNIIPDKDRACVFFTGSLYLPYQELCCHCGLIPAGKYFYLQDMHIGHDEVVKKEIYDYLDNTPPRWIVSEASYEDGYIKPYLKRYKLVYTTPDGVLNIWKSK